MHRSTKHEIKMMHIVQDLIVNKGHWVGEIEYAMKVIVWVVAKSHFHCLLLKVNVCLRYLQSLRKLPSELSNREFDVQNWEILFGNRIHWKNSQEISVTFFLELTISVHNGKHFKLDLIRLDLIRPYCTVFIKSMLRSKMTTRALGIQVKNTLLT